MMQKSDGIKRDSISANLNGVPFKVSYIPLTTFATSYCISQILKGIKVKCGNPSNRKLTLIS